MFPMAPSAHRGGTSRFEFYITSCTLALFCYYGSYFRAQPLKRLAFLKMNTMELKTGLKIGEPLIRSIVHVDAFNDGIQFPNL